MPSTTHRTFVAVCALALAALGLVACSNSLPSGTTTDSAASQEQSYQQYVDNQRDALLSVHPDADIPEVDLIRYVSATDWAPAIVDCMLGQGFGASLLADGGVSYDEPPAGQEEAQAIAVYVCMAEYPVEPTSEQLTEDQLRTLYDYYVNELVPCLADAGYDVIDAPSFETFRDSYSTSPWSPYSSVAPSTQAEWDKINTICPQNPDNL